MEPPALGVKTMVSLEFSLNQHKAQHKAKHCIP